MLCWGKDPPTSIGYVAVPLLCPISSDNPASIELALAPSKQPASSELARSSQPATTQLARYPAGVPVKPVQT